MSLLHTDTCWISDWPFTVMAHILRLEQGNQSLEKSWEPTLKVNASRLLADQTMASKGPCTVFVQFKANIACMSRHREYGK